MRPMAGDQFVTIELRFRTPEDIKGLGARIRDSVEQIIAPGTLEDFRLRSFPAEPDKPVRGHLREV
jgi:hypothetical protein